MGNAGHPRRCRGGARRSPDGGDRLAGPFSGSSGHRGFRPGVWQHVDANVTAHHHADGQAAPAADDRGPGDDAPVASDHHHGSDRGTASHDHHGSDDGGTEATNADSSDAQETASTGASLVDVMTGSAGHAPVAPAMTTIPVGLALALATIGLGGAGVPRERTPREGMPL